MIGRLVDSVLEADRTSGDDVTVNNELRGEARKERPFRSEAHSSRIPAVCSEKRRGSFHYKAKGLREEL